MKNLVVLGFLGAIVAGGFAGCGRGSGATPKQATPPGEKQWTTDEMAADPEGYFVWADQQLGSQIKQRETRLASAIKKQAELGQQRQKFLANFEDVKNLNQRLGTAIRRANEEDRWPVTIGGRQLDKEHAEATLEETRKQVEMRAPLAKSYDDAATKLDRAVNQIRDDLARLVTLRETVSVDLERYRIDKSNPAAEKMRSTEQAIAHYSKLLSSMGEDAAGAVPRGAASVDIQSLFK